MQVHALEGTAKNRQRRIHRCRMERMADVQPGRCEVVFGEHLGEHIDRHDGTTDNGQRRCIAPGDFNAGQQSRRQLIRTHAHGQHGAGWLREHRGTARNDQRNGILKAENTGAAGRHVFADAMPDHRHWHTAPRLP